MSDSKKDTLIIIPAFNEAWNIAALLHELHQHTQSCDILVVNDASEDDTSAVAYNTNLAYVLDLPYNMGIGTAVQLGFKFAHKHGYQYALQCDADGQHPPREIERLLKLVKINKADVVIGSRFRKRLRLGYQSTFLRRLGINLFRWVTLVLIRMRITDCTSGFRAYNRRAIEFLANNYPSDYPEPEAIILLGRNGFKISEIYTPMRSREGGKSSITNRSFFYMTKVLLAMFMTASRSRIM